MIVYGLISPHPPIIIPEIGQSETAKVKQTITALEAAAKTLAHTQPQRLIIISPHEKHGFEVPMYYLKKYLPTEIEIKEILVTEDSYQYYYDYGRQIGQQERGEAKPCAIVASGDLSHVLKAEGPYGYHPSGPVLDEIIVGAVRKNDAQALLSIDPAVLEAGAECGLRSILFLLGALEGLGFQPQVLSYEGPFGVGYMVATFAGTTSDPVTALARAAIKQYLEAGQVLDVPKNLPAILTQQAGAFVSLHQKNGQLRGCIGTTEPTKNTLAGEIIANAVAAAIRDPRFDPVQLTELENLEISVDVLNAPVTEKEATKLDPQKYGIVVTATDGRRGVLLPNIEGVETATEQIAICREKAGIDPNEPIEVAKFSVERHYE